jgi:osmotically-inducible protein OsmY
MKTDQQLQQEVRAQLHWDPSLTETDITVTVADGVVTLSGSVPFFAEKTVAERAAQRVVGVTAIVEAMEVRPIGSHQRADADIATAVVSALAAHVFVPNTVQATIEKGWVVLSGDVCFGFQRDAAVAAVGCLYGVQGVTNRVEVRAPADVAAVQTSIEAALRRDAELDARNIKVTTAGGCVTLAGSVRSWDEREEARAAAWSTAGVTEVQNELRVQS